MDPDSEGTSKQVEEGFLTEPSLGPGQEKTGEAWATVKYLKGCPESV